MKNPYSIAGRKLIPYKYVQKTIYCPYCGMKIVIPQRVERPLNMDRICEKCGKKYIVHDDAVYREDKKSFNPSRRLNIKEEEIQVLNRHVSEKCAGCKFRTQTDPTEYPCAECTRSRYGHLPGSLMKMDWWKK